MIFAQKNKTFLIEEYVDKKKSTYQIAQELNTNPKRIQRALKFLGVELRSYSDAQKNSLEVGNATHPTKGKKISESTKTKISRAVSKYWDKMSEEEKLSRSNVAKEQWAAMSQEERQELFTKAAEGCRKAAKEGSKMEKFVKDELVKLGYKVKYHERTLIRDAKLEIDIYLPDLNMAIEIDGISHFEPVWGAEALEKQQKADIVKAGLVLSLGFVMLRVKQTCKIVSRSKMSDTLAEILKVIKDVEANFPEEDKRYIEIEVN
jgi:very-short-patch-repair endonuclease